MHPSALDTEMIHLLPSRLQGLAASLAARGVMVVFLSQAAGAGLALLVHVLLARWGGPYVYGLYSYAAAWTLTLAIGVGMGFPTAALRFVPIYEATGRWAYLNGIVQRGEHIVLLAGVTIAGAATITLWLMNGLPLSATPYAVLVGLWSLPAVGLMRFHTETCRALNHIAAAYVAPRLLRPIVLLSGFALLAVLPNGWFTGGAVMAVFGLSFVPVVLLQRHTVRHHLSTITSPAMPQYDMRRWIHVAAPLLLVAGFVTLLHQTDLLLVGWMLNVEAAGQYKAAASVAAPVGFVLVAINGVAAPHFARYHAEGDLRRLQHLLRRLAHGLFWPTLGLAVAVMIGAKPLLGLFGPSFVDARAPLFLLALSHIVNAGAGSVGYLLNMTGHQNDAARVYGIVAALNLGTNVIGIYFFGLAGAAAASTLSMLLWNAWLHRLVQQRLGVEPSIVHALRVPHS